MLSKRNIDRLESSSGGEAPCIVFGNAVGAFRSATGALSTLGKKTSTLDINTIVRYNKTRILDKKEGLLSIAGDDEHLERIVLL